MGLSGMGAVTSAAAASAPANNLRGGRGLEDDGDNGVKCCNGYDGECHRGAGVSPGFACCTDDDQGNWYPFVGKCK